MSLIRIEHVTKRYGELTVLDDVSLSVNAGDIVAVIGRSGAGKSTMLRCINALEAIQGTPLLAQLFVFFFGFAIFGYRVSPWIAAGVAFSIYASAFLAEIWRGCVEAVPRQQWEASAALGLGFGQQLRYVIVPQAFRISIPPTVGFLVQLVKNTSLASVIGFVELTREGQITTGATFRPFLVYGIVALLYFLICFPLSQWSQYLERRLNVAHTH